MAISMKAGRLASYVSFYKGEPQGMEHSTERKKEVSLW